MTTPRTLGIRKILPMHLLRVDFPFNRVDIPRPWGGVLMGGGDDPARKANLVMACPMPPVATAPPAPWGQDRIPGYRTRVRVKVFVGRVSAGPVVYRLLRSDLCLVCEGARYPKGTNFALKGWFDRTIDRPRSRSSPPRDEDT